MRTYLYQCSQCGIVIKFLLPMAWPPEKPFGCSFFDCDGAAMLLVTDPEIKAFDGVP